MRVAAFLLFCCLGIATEARAVSGDTLFTKEGAVNVYSDPSPNAQLVMQLDRGRKLVEIKREGSWVKVGVFRLGASGLPTGFISDTGWVRRTLVFAAVFAVTVIVDSSATGGFGIFPEESPPAGGTLMVSGYVFEGPSTVVVIATGTIDINPDVPELEAISPHGRNFYGQDFGRTRASLGYLPLEEASVDGGADFNTFSSTLPLAGALMGAFVPKSTVDSPGFFPEDEDFGMPAIGSDQLFFIGSRPFEFRATEPGTLFLGINDSRASNNTGSFKVKITLKSF